MSEQKIYISKDKLSYIRDKISAKVVKSDVIRKIVVVDELPETEEENVLYLVKQPEVEPGPENLWKNQSIIEGWFNDDASYATVEEGNNSYYAYIACEPNTTYTITRTMNGYRFMVGTSSTEPNSGTTYFTNYIVASSLQEVEITSGENDSYLAIYYRGSNESLDETELLNDITVVKKQQSSVSNNYVTDSLGVYINAAQGIEDLSGNEVSLTNGGNLQTADNQISFNGLNQYIAAEYVPTDTINFTVEFYGTLKKKSSEEGLAIESHSILSFGTQSPNKLSLQVMYQLEGIAVWGNTAGDDKLATSLQEDTLTHIVYRISNGTLDCFVNGVKYSNLITDWQAITNFSEVVIGAKYSKDEQFLYGALNQFRIYNKVLTDDEVQQNYNFCIS